MGMAAYDAFAKVKRKLQYEKVSEARANPHEFMLPRLATAIFRKRARQYCSLCL